MPYRIWPASWCLCLCSVCMMSRITYLRRKALTDHKRYPRVRYDRKREVVRFFFNPLLRVGSSSDSFETPPPSSRHDAIANASNRVSFCVETNPIRPDVPHPVKINATFWTCPHHRAISGMIFFAMTVTLEIDRSV